MFLKKNTDPAKELLSTGEISHKSAIYLINKIIETKEDVTINIHLDFLSRKMNILTNAISTKQLDSDTYLIKFEDYQIKVIENRNPNLAKAHLEWNEDVFGLTFSSYISDFQTLIVRFISDTNGLSREEFLRVISE